MVQYQFVVIVVVGMHAILCWNGRSWREKQQECTGNFSNNCAPRKVSRCTMC